MRCFTEEDFFRLYPKLLAKFRSLGESHDEARDLAQETLKYAYGGMDGFKGRSQFDTWVMAIGKNLWLKKHRDRGRQKRSAEEVSIDSVSVPRVVDARQQSVEDVVIARDRLARVKEDILQLPESMRQALLLFVQGHKYQRIACILGISESRVSSLIHQARRRLRRV